MKKLNIRLLRMIKGTAGQFISVMAIVAAALSIYVLFNITSININTAVDTYYRETNINDLQIQLIKIPESAVNDIKTIEGVEAVQGRLSFDVPLVVEDKNEKVRIRIISIPDTGEKINKLFNEKGRTLKIKDNKVILLQQFAKARNLLQGEKITPYINGKQQTLVVSDIAASSEYVYLMENVQSLLPAPEKFGVAYLSEKYAQTIFGYNGYYNEVLVTLKDKTKITDVSDKIEKKLNKYGVKTIIKLSDQLSDNVLKQKMASVEKMSNIIPVLFLLVAAIIIVIMLSRIVSNDRMAIGVLKALGYSNISILAHYTGYSLAIGLGGAIIGITTGFLLAGPMTRLFITYFNIPFVGVNIFFGYIFSAIILTSAFCIISGLIGARSVIKIMPADSMRPETPKSGKRILLERVTFIWKRFSFSWKMVIRNILRAKKRFCFLVFGLALTYAINTVPLYEATAIPKMFQLQYGEYQKMDYLIDFDKPINVHSIGQIGQLIKAEKIEPKLEYPFELKNGWLKKTVSVIGIPADTSCYVFRDSKDNEILLKNNGIFLTEAIAASLNVKEGDKITIKNFLPGKKDKDIIVKGVVKQYLGSNAYMDITLMQTLLLNKEMINGVAIKSSDNVKDKLNTSKNIASIRSVTDMKNSFLEFMNTLALAVNMYLIFGGLLGFAIIYNSTIISISERRMELSALRVMGFDKKDLFWIICRENIIMTILAIILGIPMAMGMIKAMAKSISTDMITLPVIYSINIFVYAAAATFLFVMAAQLATWKKISGLDFIEALKSRIS